MSNLAPLVWGRRLTGFCRSKPTYAAMAGLIIGFAVSMAVVSVFRFHSWAEVGIELALPVAGLLIVVAIVRRKPRAKMVGRGPVPSDLTTLDLEMERFMTRRRRFFRAVGRSLMVLVWPACAHLQFLGRLHLDAYFRAEDAREEEEQQQRPLDP